MEALHIILATRRLRDDRSSLGFKMSHEVMLFINSSCFNESCTVYYHLFANKCALILVTRRQSGSWTNINS